MSVSSPVLLKDLQRQVTALEVDLRHQAEEALPELGASLRREYDEAVAAGRTADAWTA